MTDRTRTFTIPYIDPDDDPIEFNLAFKVKVREPRDADDDHAEPWVDERVEDRVKTLRCLPMLPPAILLDGLLAQTDDLKMSLGACIRFIRGALTEESEATFVNLVYSKSTIVDDVTLGEVVEWLTEVYVDRPTPPSAG